MRSSASLRTSVLPLEQMDARPGIPAIRNQAYPRGQHMPGFRPTLFSGTRPCRSSSAPAVGSIVVLTGSSRGTSPASYECRDWRSSPPARSVDPKRPASRHHAFRGRELGETCHRPPRDRRGRSPYRLAVRPWSPLATIETPPESAKPPSPRQDARQTVLCDHVPNPRAEGSAVWLELYLRAHRQVLA